MLVILCQHGRAHPENVDPQRPLTDEGKNETEKVAQFVASFMKEVSLIVHSGKLRAKQTAEIINRFIKPQNGIEEWDGISPKDDPVILKERLESKNIPSLVIVGHMPHLQRFASLVLAGDAERGCVSFENSGFVALECDESQVWKVKWMVVPSIL